MMLPRPCTLGLVLVVAALALLSPADGQTTRFVGQIAVKNAALLNTFTHSGNSNNRQR